ncbi:MAG: DUF2971 domain-containing protein [Reinekea sp.]
MNNFLYKYKGLDKHALEVLINRELYFPTTNQFNDPFDGQLLPSDFIIELNELGYAGHEEEISRHDDFIKNRINEYGVLSLSRVWDDILMWSHYANAHKGICFGFKNDLLRYFDNYYCPIEHKTVCYSKDHPFKEIHSDLVLQKRFNSNDGFLNLCEMSSALEDAAFTVKHSSWSYEKEERIISHCIGPHSFQPKALDHIVLGMNISRHDEATIKSFLNIPTWDHVRIFRATRGRAALSIDVNEENVQP